MKKLKKYFILMVMLSMPLLSGYVYAGPGGSKLNSDPKNTKTSVPRSPSYGDTILPLEEGYYTLPTDALEIIPQYRKSAPSKKTPKIIIPPAITAEIDSAVAQLSKQLENPALLYAGDYISREIFVTEDESYPKNLEHLEKFFQGIQDETKDLAATKTLVSPNRVSARLSTTFRYADFMSKAYRIINSLPDPKQRLYALQTILMKLSKKETPIYIFSPAHTDLITNLNPYNVDAVTTALVAEGTRMQNDILTPGTMAILLEFSSKTPKSKTPPLSLLFFIR